MSKATVRQAFNAMTSRQINKRNKAFADGWQIIKYWCGEYIIGHNNKEVARIVKGPRGGLNITML